MVFLAVKENSGRSIDHLSLRREMKIDTT